MEEILKQQIHGLEAKISELEKAEKAFIRVQGIDEEIEKSRALVQSLEPEIQGLKEEIEELKGKKSTALAGTMEALAKKMGEVMPLGEAVFAIEDGRVSIGMKIEGKTIPYAGLSGGQKAVFDQALAYTLLGPGPKIIIVEAAEMDYTRLLETLQSIESSADENTQYIVNTWTKPRPGAVSEKWQVVNL